jgi:hypothetical protein
MAFQFLPILKILAPIATAAIPAFTSKPKESLKTDPVVILQIEELQAAVSKNALSLHTLAENLQQTIQNLEVAATDATKQIGAYKTMLFIAIGLAGIATLLSLYLLIK